MISWGGGLRLIRHTIRWTWDGIPICHLTPIDHHLNRGYKVLASMSSLTLFQQHLKDLGITPFPGLSGNDKRPWGSVDEKLVKYLFYILALAVQSTLWRKPGLLLLNQWGLHLRTGPDVDTRSMIMIFYCNEWNQPFALQLLMFFLIQIKQ